MKSARCFVLLLATLGAACGEDGMAPLPPGSVPSPPASPPAVVPGPAFGPTRITFAGADPPPGAPVAGCGAFIGGCAGRVTIGLGLQSPSGGSVLYVRVFLHDGATLRACLIGQTGPLTLRPGVVERVDVVLDEADDCRTPTDIRTMAAVVEGTVEVASRQEWGIRYAFLP
jgi:hypothetical protein